MNLPEPGTHPARALAAAVYENDNQTLVLCLQVETLSDPPARLRAYQSLTTKDGAINTRCIANLRSAFPGWDGTDPFWFETADLGAYEVDIVVEHEDGRDGNTYAKVAWINPRGGRGAALPKSGDRNAILAKYGSRFRALAGGAAAPAPKPPPPPAPPAADPPADAPEDAPPQAEPPRTAEMQDCWRKLCEKNPGKDRAALTQIWWQVIKSVGGEKPQGDFTAEDWGRVLTAVEDDLPF